MSVSALALLTISFTGLSAPRSVLSRPHAVMASPREPLELVSSKNSLDEPSPSDSAGLKRDFGSKFSTPVSFAERAAHDLWTHADHVDDAHVSRALFRDLLDLINAVCDRS